MDLYAQEENFYHVVGVDRDASFADIKRAFRQRSVEIHPDKNPSPTATEEFNRLRLAFDVRSDVQLEGFGWLMLMCVLWWWVDPGRRQQASTVRSVW